MFAYNKENVWATGRNLKAPGDIEYYNKKHQHSSILLPLLLTFLVSILHLLNNDHLSNSGRTRSRGCFYANRTPGLLSAGMICIPEVLIHYSAGITTRQSKILAGFASVECQHNLMDK